MKVFMQRRLRPTVVSASLMSLGDKSIRRVTPRRRRQYLHY